MKTRRILFIFSLFFICSQSLFCFSVVSSAVGGGELIDQKYTCDGEGVSPGFSCRDVPLGTKYFAILFIDRTSYFHDVHWFVYNIPAEVTTFPEGVGNEKKSTVMVGGKIVYQGRNKFNEFGYAPICPGADEREPGRVQLDFRPHDYHFTVYALRKKMEFDGEREDLSEDDIIQIMENDGGVVGRVTVAGRYTKKTGEECCAAKI